MTTRSITSTQRPGQGRSAFVRATLEPVAMDVGRQGGGASCDLDGCGHGNGHGPCREEAPSHPGEGSA